MANQNPLISVIIPVYRAEEYLPQCFDSVLGQTYSNLEVILVDDGSPGDSPRICDDYAARDSRICVIHKQNGGLADARNAGLDVAAGEFILHVDCDDWIAPDMVELLYNDIITNDADISVCFEYESFSNVNIPKKHYSLEQPIVLSNVQAVEMFLTKRELPAAWGKLYKKHIFDNIRYPVGKLPEDAWVILDIIMAANTISFSPVCMYYYRQRKSSILHKDSLTTKLLPKLEMFETRHRRITSNYPGLTLVCDAQLYRRYIISILTILSDSDYHNTPAGNELMTSLLSKIQTNTKSLLKNSYLTKTEKLELRILNTRFYMTALKSINYKKKLRRKLKQRKERKNPAPEKMLFE